MSDTIDDQALQHKCDYDRCHCVPGGEAAITDGKSVYCSQGCRDGTGCTHEECNCANEG